MSSTESSEELGPTTENPAVVLVHGWGYSFYHKNLSEDVSHDYAWQHRAQLLELLSTRYSLNLYNLPGFIDKPEPNVPSYKITDFAADFSSYLNQLRKTSGDLAFILGYSFGGAVALTHKLQTQDPTPLVLVSPALSRSESNASSLAHFVGTYTPDAMRAGLAHVYQMLLNPYYRNASPFLRRTYNHIVGVDLSNSLADLPDRNILFVYGDSDEDTPWNNVAEKVIALNLAHEIIVGGGHNIGGTHPAEVFSAIESFFS